MGSMVMSTVMMFIPRHVVFLFLAICCIGFFGIYVPYNESKKKGEAWPPLRWLDKVRKIPKDSQSVQRYQRDPSSISARLEQLESLKSAGLIDGREFRRKREEILKK